MSFYVRKPTQTPVVVIRAATGNELSNYEKNKLANIEENAQENKIEVISLNIGGDKQRIAALNKEVVINLGELSNKDKITPKEISSEELFMIKCELEEAYNGN